MLEQPSSVYRYEVPVDDRCHEFELSGPIVHVASRRPDVVEFWAYNNPGQPEESVTLRVFGTGHPIDVDGEISHVGSALVGPLVWHLVKITSTSCERAS
jgi:hypothetical protein